MKLNDICRIVAKSHIKVGAIYKKLDGAASCLVDFLKILEIKNGEPFVISCKEDGSNKNAASSGFWSDIQMFRKVG